MDSASDITSFVLTSPADALLRDAIATALQRPPDQRASFLAQRLSEIKHYMDAHPAERPWTFTEYRGTDGSRIFRGGIGHSLVVDPQGGVWRARSYEDFVTTYTFAGTDCAIASLTPIYTDMRRCEAEGGASATRRP